MAYTEQQHQEHIFELQTYLHGLAHFYDLPAVTPDGVYGENTASAVREFQQKNSLRPTGVTNTATWNAIVQAYLADTAPPTASFSIFPDGIFAYTLGDQNSGVYLIQGLLQAIRKQFLFSLPVLTSSGTYDTATQQAMLGVPEAHRSSGHRRCQSSHMESHARHLPEHAGCAGVSAVPALPGIEKTVPCTCARYGLFTRSHGIRRPRFHVGGMPLSAYAKICAASPSARKLRSCASVYFCMPGQ